MGRRRPLAGGAAVRRLTALLAQRCPRCLRAPVFAGLLRMNEHCPDCGLRFEREHGYFTGAMVVSYMLAIPALALLSIAVLWATRWRVEWALLAADVLFLAFVPLIFRYSRILWMYFDRAVDPDGNN